MTEQDHVEEIRLKKKKLQLKDQMNSMIQKFETNRVTNILKPTFYSVFEFHVVAGFSRRPTRAKARDYTKFKHKGPERLRLHPPERHS